MFNYVHSGVVNARSVTPEQFLASAPGLPMAALQNPDIMAQLYLRGGPLANQSGLGGVAPTAINPAVAGMSSLLLG